MKLEFIALGNLSVSKSNMRHARKAPDVADILPTVRARGVLQPVLVRPCAPPEEHLAAGAADPQAHARREARHYEIVAGSRRFHAACIVAAERLAASAETGEPDPEIVLLPCAVLDEADDASAVEASLIENIARLDPDEVSRWACFNRLVKEGRSIAEIGATFGLPDLAVRRALALDNLLPRIREMYRQGEIDAVSIRHLTLASRSQQKSWLMLVDDPDAYAPRGHSLKSWLLGGASISTRHALFDVEGSGLTVVTDLFGEDAYFAEGVTFWALQNAAIEARRLAYIEAGWADAVVVPPDEHFNAWEYEKTAKRKGGRVYLDVRGNGEVVVHEGYLSRKEAARLAKSRNAGQCGEDEDGSGGGTSPVRAELTSLTQTYVDLHRHAAVRTELLGSPALALRLVVAHVRRLEAMRRARVDIEREADGTWRISPEHLEQVKRFEDRLFQDRPVDVEVLSALPVDKLIDIDGASWVDRELASPSGLNFRAGGFGGEVRAAVTARRQWLVEQGLADEDGENFALRPNALASLRRRELLRIAAGLSDELGKGFAEVHHGDWIEGSVARRVGGISGSYALIEKSREFTLVPWRPVLEKQIGQQAAGIMRDSGISWQFGRGRAGPEIS
jgi:ParB-like chromosome segregation protein Spo0J